MAIRFLFVLIAATGCASEQGMVRIDPKNQPGPASEAAEGENAAAVDGLGDCEYAYPVDPWSGKKAVVSSYPEFAIETSPEQAVAPGDAVDITVTIAAAGCGGVRIGEMYWMAALDAPMDDVVRAGGSDLAATLERTAGGSAPSWQTPFVLDSSLGAAFVYAWSEDPTRTEDAFWVGEGEPATFRFAWYDTADLPSGATVGLRLFMLWWTSDDGWDIGPDTSPIDADMRAAYVVEDSDN